MYRDGTGIDNIIVTTRYTVVLEMSVGRNDLAWIVVRQTLSKILLPLDKFSVRTESKREKLLADHCVFNVQ